MVFLFWLCYTLFRKPMFLCTEYLLLNYILRMSSCILKISSALFFFEILSIEWPISSTLQPRIRRNEQYTDIPELYCPVLVTSEQKISYLNSMLFVIAAVLENRTGRSNPIHHHHNDLRPVIDNNTPPRASRLLRPPLLLSVNNMHGSPPNRTCPFREKSRSKPPCRNRHCIS